VAPAARREHAGRAAVPDPVDFDALDVVEEALRAFGGTVLTVTHDAYFAEAVGHTRCWSVRDGRVSECAPS
jgi:ATPase subunit of ABC transporter with duplicated ATPase domains